jgi:predicted PurR-regulated permease PerM
MGLQHSTERERTLAMGQTARRAAVVTLVAVAIIVLALALWKIRIVIALLFLGFIVAAAMRPGVEGLRRRAHVPRAVGVLLHYLVIALLIGVVLWLFVPRAVHQVQAAGSASALHQQARQSSGIKRQILTDLEKRLNRLPSGSKLLHPAVEVTKTAFEVLVGIFFVFAVGAYWIFERDRAIALVQSLLPRRRRRVVRDTWVLLDEKLGAFVRGELLMIGFVSVVLSTAFFAIGLPYWLLIGVFAGIVEIVPVVGPLAAGALAVGVGLTQSWHMALFAALIVIGVRQFQDYVVAPRVLGHATGLSPLVLISATGVGVLLGPFYVLLAVPITAVLVTLVDVIVRGVEPAEQEVPSLLFTREESGT